MKNNIDTKYINFHRYIHFLSLVVRFQLKIIIFFLIFDLFVYFFI
jgi:hypothetical protein